MWFCYRKIHDYRDGENAYQIGYAHSKDAENWTRNDSLCGLKKSAQGWDSKMTCYPSVISVKDKIYMIYNGNYFGQTGFGLAILK